MVLLQSGKGHSSKQKPQIYHEAPEQGDEKKSCNSHQTHAQTWAQSTATHSGPLIILKVAIARADQT